MDVREQRDVPVIVETPSRPYFDMVRCNYLYVECDEPRPGWQITLSRGTMPFLMLGLVGIIQTPFDAARFFEERQLDELFEFTEEGAELLIQFADMWLPRFLFGNPTVTVGDVYRLGFELFTAAYLFRDGRLSDEGFLGRAREFHESCIFSAEETRTFDSWSRRTVEAAMSQEDKNPELKLRRRG
jgi:hypothetical protein